jgi:hypothetical protein
MGGTLSTHGSYIHTKCGRKTLREETTQKTRHKWEDNIRMDLRERGWEGVDWIHLAQDRDQWSAVVNTVMNLRAP